MMLLLTNLLRINMALLVVMLGAFALIDRYAKRHPYGTGHFGKMERRRRAREARRKRAQQPNGQAKARNEAVMADMLAPLRPEADAKPTARPVVEPHHRGTADGGSDPVEQDPRPAVRRRGVQITGEDPT